MIDLALLHQKTGKTRLNIQELLVDKQLSPCRLFQMTNSQLIEVCVEASRLSPEFIRVFEDKGGTLIELLPSATPEKILSDFYNAAKA